MTIEVTSSRVSVASKESVSNVPPVGLWLSVSRAQESLAAKRNKTQPLVQLRLVSDVAPEKADGRVPSGLRLSPPGRVSPP